MIESKYVALKPEEYERFVRILKSFISHKKYSWLTVTINRLHHNVLAGIWNFFSEDERPLLLNALSTEKCADLISVLDTKDRRKILLYQDAEWIRKRLKELPSDDVVDILKDISIEKADFIIKKFDESYSQKIKLLLKYEEEIAGSLMSFDFLTVNANATVDNIIDKFRKYAEKEDLSETHFIYVVNYQNKLLGYIPIRKLITEKSFKKAKEIMHEPVVLLHPNMDQEEVAKIFKDYDLISAPVVDKDNLLLGRITIDDIVDVIEDEASEDFYRMTGITQQKPSDNVLTSFKSRFPWMLINLLTTSLSALVIYFFQPILQKYIVLAVFMPIIAALGGSIGNQMVAIIVRDIVTESLLWGHLKKILLRDTVSAFLGSLPIGIIVSFVSYSLSKNWILGLIVFLSLVMNMILSTIIGLLVPFILKYFHRDPALGSSIIVTAITDMLGFFIFLFLAYLFL